MAALSCAVYHLRAGGSRASHSRSGTGNSLPATSEPSHAATSEVWPASTRARSSKLRICSEPPTASTPTGENGYATLSTLSMSSSLVVQKGLCFLGELDESWGCHSPRIAVVQERRGMRRLVKVVRRCNPESFEVKGEPAQSFALATEAVDKRLLAVPLLGAQPVFGF